MVVEWSTIAFEDILGIQDYIARNSPHYAEIFTSRLMTATNSLSEFPELGRKVPEADDLENIRELIYHSYRIIYQVSRDENRILIVTVVHGSRDIAGGENRPWDVV